MKSRYSNFVLKYPPGIAPTAHAWLMIVVACAFLQQGCRLDMHLQPKYNPEVPSSFFTNGSSAREPVPGTVARGQLRTDELLYTGMENGTVSNVFPFAITEQDMARGREQYNIYCSPCHDYAGYGNGMIVQRGFPQLPSYHTDRLRSAPVGHFFGVITDGFGLMYSYGTRIAPDDRWRIVAYIRALQLSQHAPVQDVPVNQLGKLGVSR